MEVQEISTINPKFQPAIASFMVPIRVPTLKNYPHILLPPILSRCVKNH